MLAANPRTGPGWVHEVKHDGYRLLALKDAGRVTLWSRYATDYTDTFLRIAEAVRALPIDSALLDGEAVVFGPDGHSDFAALRTNKGAAQGSLVAYDLLRFQGEDWRSMPLEVRRAQLGSLVDGVDGITFSQAIEGDGVLVFDHACRLGLEGIVSKRLGGLYASGRCRNWLKVKNLAFERR
jgi:bifunctional non-homologous end joining protein LigD